MLAVAPSPILGHERPRVGPPRPLRSDIAGFRRVAVSLGISPMPWQEVAASYITALGPDDRWQYGEVAVIVSRQNGKTTLLIPLIVSRLLDGQRIMHTAQDRSLPREVFYAVAEFMWEKHRDLFPSRNGRATKPRYANGTEEIRLTNGGIYTIVAPSRGGARGPSRDLVIIDELREMDTWDFIAGAKPTLTASPNPQMLYLSNAGTDTSIVLNALRDRRDDDPNLAYLEYSADPSRVTDDPEGWAESNPAMGHEPEGMGSVRATLENEHRTALLEGTMALYEIEHLCRWVPTMRPRLVDEFGWARGRVARLDRPKRPAIGISYDLSGRASVVMAWRIDDKDVGLKELFDVEVDETGIPELGRDALALARKWGCVAVGYDDATDRDLARQFTGPLAKKTKPVIGKDFANASEAFVRAVEAGTVKWMDGDHIATDLRSTSRRENGETGTYAAVRSKDDVPIPAALAAIRAYWLATSSPLPTPPRIY